MNNSSLKVCVVIPSYSPYCQIIPTLESLLKSFNNYSNQRFTLLLSDSSPNLQTIEKVREWSNNNNCELIIERSSTRRIMKSALNAAFQRDEIATFDIVIVTNDDVIFKDETVTYLVNSLNNDPNAMVSVGVATLDEKFYSKRVNKKSRRASAWQLRFMLHLAKVKPNNIVRAEGSVWAAKIHFINEFRYTENSGSIADDIELASYLISKKIKSVNSANSLVYKIPVKGFEEFTRQTRRSQIGARGRVKSANDSWIYPAVAIFLTFVENPIESFYYVVFRIGMLLKFDKKYDLPSYDWIRSESSFRNQ